MADPTGYEPQYDFSNYQSANPSRPLPGHELDVELWNISNAIGGTQTALSGIRRSDGKLQNGIVTVDALAPDLRPDGQVAVAAAAAAAASAAQAALYDGVWTDTIAALRADTALTYTAGQPGTVAADDYVLTRAEGGIFKVAGSGASDHHLTTAGGVKLYVSPLAARVTPRMFGAAGDGSTDDLLPIRACWDFAGANNVPVYMEGLEYNCSNAVFTSSNLTVYGQGAVMYITAWPAVGGFVNNVRPVIADRVQSNIRIYDLVTDGSKLPPPSAVQNTNLGPEFARGASNVRIVNCTARFMRRGFGSGSGGGGFGGEQGLEDVVFDGCVAHNCFRGIRVAGMPGSHADAGAQLKSAVGVVFRDTTLRECDAAIFCHSIDATGDDVSNLAVFDALFDGVYIEDCGHAAWSDVDYTTYPALVPQKSGVIVFGGAQNIRMRGVRVKINSDYTTREDWLGRTGYPSSGTNYTGAGLTGRVGALVWGWGRNIIVEDMTLDGTVDCVRRFARAVALGEIASTPPGRLGAENEQNDMAFIHVGGGAVANVVDGWLTSGGTGMDVTYSAEVVHFTTYAFATDAVVKADATPSGGMATVTGIVIDLRTFRGVSTWGNAVQWLANTSTASATDFLRKGGIELGGGYSSTGARAGLTYDATTGLVRASVAGASDAYLQAFYNTNGLVGGVKAEASRTKFYLTSTIWVSAGAGSPEGVVTAPVGCMWMRSDGGASTTLYVKTSGTGNTGWTAK